MTGAAHEANQRDKRKITTRVTIRQINFLLFISKIILSIFQATVNYCLHRS